MQPRYRCEGRQAGRGADAMNFSSQEFYDMVVVPNVAAQHADTGGYRHAVNAIASLDD